MIRTTTKKHFQIYSDTVRYWIKQFGLLDWALYFSHEKLDCLFAQMVLNYNGRVVTFKFSTLWNDYADPLTVANVKFAGRHEAIHLLLADLAYLGSERFVTSDSLIVMEEALVSRLEKLLPE